MQRGAPRRRGRGPLALPVEELRRDLVEERAGRVVLGLPPHGAELGAGEVEALAGPGETHVGQAALLLHLLGLVVGTVLLGSAVLLQLTGERQARLVVERAVEPLTRLRVVRRIPRLLRDDPSAFRGYVLAQPRDAIVDLLNSEDLVVNGFLEASQTDIFPVTVVAVVLLLLGAAALASLIPARRATRVEPSSALQG